eukprot:PLAT4218.1.p1 GENE.PLAT4218.1~~PLAT4218.1.p1  ORF type:complete len:196 (-),score=73.92 PLAT4218.1:93-680(-)
MLLYVAGQTLSLPVSTLGNVIAGALFGLLQGGMTALLATMLGSTAAFLLARAIGVDALARWLPQRARAWQLQHAPGGQAEQAEEEEGSASRRMFFLCLHLRLSPLFPSWLTTIMSALLRAPLSTFWLTTLLGTPPNLYTHVSAGVAVATLGGEAVTKPGWKTLSALAALAVAALLPLLCQRRMRAMASQRLQRRE